MDLPELQVRQGELGKNFAFLGLNQQEVFLAAKESYIQDLPAL